MQFHATNKDKNFNIKVPASCTTDKPPKLLTPPPLTVWAVQGENVTIKALYKGDFDDISEANLLAYWLITTLDGSTRCIYPTDNYTSYYVTTNDCLPADYCYFTVSIEIESLTLDLSQTNLTSVVLWLDDLKSFNPGNSILGMSVLLGYYNCVSFVLIVVYVYPTLVEQLPPNANNTCIELHEGKSTEFRCKYTAILIQTSPLPLGNLTKYLYTITPVTIQSLLIMGLILLMPTVFCQD